MRWGRSRSSIRDIPCRVVDNEMSIESLNGAKRRPKGPGSLYFLLIPTWTAVTYCRTRHSFEHVRSWYQLICSRLCRFAFESDAQHWSNHSPDTLLLLLSRITQYLTKYYIPTVNITLFSKSRIYFKWKYSSSSLLPWTFDSII